VEFGAACSRGRWLVKVRASPGDWRGGCVERRGGDGRLGAGCGEGRREVRRRYGSVEVDVRARVMLCCWFVVFDVT
jgi:hypothetical protein